MRNCRWYTTWGILLSMVFRDYYCFKSTEVAGCVCVESFGNWLCEWQNSCCGVNLSVTSCFTCLIFCGYYRFCKSMVEVHIRVRIQDSHFSRGNGTWCSFGMGNVNGNGRESQLWHIPKHLSTLHSSCFMPFKHVRNVHLCLYALFKFSAVSVQRYEVTLWLDCAVFLWPYLKLCSKLSYSDHYTVLLSRCCVICSCRLSRQSFELRIRRQFSFIRKFCRNENE